MTVGGVRRRRRYSRLRIGCNANGRTPNGCGCMAASETKQSFALVVMTVEMAATASMATKITGGVPSEQAVSAAEAR